MNLLKKWYNTISNLFNKKNQHGFKKYCLSGKCNICQTPWPNITKTFGEQYLESIDYYSKYREVYFPSNKGDGLKHIGGIFKGGNLVLPSGMSGKEILDIAQILKPQYNRLIKGDPEEESKKIAELQGFNEEK